MKYNELISFYKSTNKKLPTTAELSAAVHQINDVVFSVLNANVFSARTNRLINELISLGKMINETEYHKAQQKKNEVLDYLRKTIKVLQKIKGVDGSPEEAQKTVRFALSQSITLKTSNPSTEALIIRLRENKTVKEDLGQHWQETNTVQFVKIQNELLEQVTRNYSLMS